MPVQVSCSGPAVTLSPSPQETLAPPTLSDARPFWVPPKDSVVPRMSAAAPSPVSVTEHELVVQDTLFDVKEQPATEISASAPAIRPAASRAVRDVDVGDMPAA